MMFTRRHAIMLATALGLAAGSLSAASAEPFRIGAYPSNPPFEYKNASGAFEEPVRPECRESDPCLQP